MKTRCLYCYEPIDGSTDFHESCSRTFFGTSSPPHIPYSIDQMEELAKNVVERSVVVPGVQPKLSVSVIKEAQKKTGTRLTVVDALGGQYILKPPTHQYPGIPQNEHLTMRIAEDFGLSTVPSSLVKLASGELAYISKRIDRTTSGDKIHMLDMFQITEAHDKYRSSMEKIGKALHTYSSNTLLDKLTVFELSLFSFLTGNNDMHLKNFSMIKGEYGWVLSPAYDLLNVGILLPEDTEELALTLEGKKKKLKAEHFKSFGYGLGLTTKQVQSAFDRVLKNKSKAAEWLDRSFLSDEMKQDYRNLLDARYDQLDLH